MKMVDSGHRYVGHLDIRHLGIYLKPQYVHPLNSVAYGHSTFWDITFFGEITASW